MQNTQNIESPFESIKAEMLSRLTGTPDKKIVQLIFKQYYVGLIEKEDVAEGTKYSVFYSVYKNSKEQLTWEFIYPQNN